MHVCICEHARACTIAYMRTHERFQCPQPSKGTCCCRACWVRGLQLRAHASAWAIVCVHACVPACLSAPPAMCACMHACKHAWMHACREGGLRGGSGRVYLHARTCRAQGSCLCPQVLCLCLHVPRPGTGEGTAQLLNGRELVLVPSSPRLPDPMLSISEWGSPQQPWLSEGGGCRDGRSGQRTPTAPASSATASLHPLPALSARHSHIQRGSQGRQGASRAGLGVAAPSQAPPYPAPSRKACPHAAPPPSP